MSQLCGTAWSEVLGIFVFKGYEGCAVLPQVDRRGRPQTDPRLLLGPESSWPMGRSTQGISLSWARRSRPRPEPSDAELTFDFFSSRAFDEPFVLAPAGLRRPREEGKPPARGEAQQRVPEAVPRSRGWLGMAPLGLGGQRPATPEGPQPLTAAAPPALGW